MVKMQVYGNRIGGAKMPGIVFVVMLGLCQSLFGTASAQIPTVGGQCPTKTPSQIDLKKVGPNTYHIN